ncbi:DNA-binding NarL/FixJ family response regulator [Saccharothrix tamanrassetensis]|uniref:DNA-binding NarL/FixJ family response regulator n=1 Tax=Saccharothrix tamanrassetensis TaxID=1051531 RepID=A0A841CIN8_9PSEU|nr:response regulator transcription factor [Saccharothrix tamanrassetensis]MBB5956843.1 DNA-binding NarL/FixJ family response regulator [Saccharothrix tamanrassetensis]
MITVLIADDQEAVREALRVVLSAEPDITVVGEAANGADAIDQALRNRPDVVVMDIRMPRLDGISAIRALAGSSRVLALTTFDLDEYLFGALRAGAAGFLLKDADPDLLVEAVRAIHRGHGLIDPRVTGRLIGRFARLSPRPTGTDLERLTDREREVMRHVAWGLTNAEIASALSIGEGTVKTHVAHVLAKLGLRTRVHVVIYAYEHGLVARDSGSF